MRWRECESAGLRSGHRVAVHEIERRLTRERGRGDLADLNGVI